MLNRLWGETALVKGSVEFIRTIVGVRKHHYEKNQPYTFYGYKGFFKKEGKVLATNLSDRGQWTFSEPLLLSHTIMGKMSR